MDIDSMNNKRLISRESIAKKVLINNLLEGHSLDISRDGMFINVPADIKVGSSITLKLHTKGVPLNIKAVVKHSQPGIGIGVQFIDLDEFKEDRIAEFIEQCRQEREQIERRGGKPIILLIDDSPASVAHFERRLILAGYSVIQARNGIEAIKQLDQNKVEMVITDLNMDGMNGFALIHLIKQTKKFKDIPVVILSATVGGDADIKRASELGIERFFMKHNTKPDLLAEEVTRILGRTRKIE
jgi:CheY-like chemotaxis protein